MAMGCSCSHRAEFSLVFVSFLIDYVKNIIKGKIM